VGLREGTAIKWWF